MAIIGNINGWNLIALPAAPGPRTVEWTATDAAGSVENPFTFNQQIFDWRAGLLSATVTMPPMSLALAGSWLAFLAEARGKNCVFYFISGRATQPQGSAEGTGVTNGSFQGPYTLTTSGWTPNQGNLLQRGDMLQIGWRMYRCCDDAVSDSAGNASFSIWPQIREIPPSGTAIVTNSAQGLFRLAKSDRSWTESYLSTYGMSFQIREAI